MSQSGDPTAFVIITDVGPVPPAVQITIKYVLIRVDPPLYPDFEPVTYAVTRSLNVAVVEDDNEHDVQRKIELAIKDHETDFDDVTVVFVGNH
jgi:hypothetical protein